MTNALILAKMADCGKFSGEQSKSGIVIIVLPVVCLFLVDFAGLFGSSFISAISSDGWHLSLFRTPPFYCPAGSGQTLFK
jgi:hypothetical protein